MRDYGDGLAVGQLASQDAELLAYSQDRVECSEGPPNAGGTPRRVRDNGAVPRMMSPHETAVLK